MAKKLTTAGDITAKRYEINQLFTPSTPVTTAELFAGRAAQMLRIIDTVAEPGRHVILYGERGVGKTSLVQIVPYLIPAETSNVQYFRIQAFPDDNFHSIAQKIFRKIKFRADTGEGEQEFDASDLYTNTITPDDFLSEFSRFGPNDVPVVAIDEFNEIKDRDTSVKIANTIKALSDAGANVTIIIIGVADNVSQLISQHQSIQRCTEEILMPRMDKAELTEVLAKRLRQLDISIEGDAKWKIVNLAKGLPSYVHALGKYACLDAIRPPNASLHVTEQNVDAAIEAMLASSDQSFKNAYQEATRSNQPGNLLTHALTACALAKTDENGYFSPVAVKEPLSNILGKPVDIANFQNHLKAFIDPKRLSILHRIGEPRAYRFRFQQPAMQPYVIMMGITEGILDEKAKRALSYPEQPDLFSTGP